ncbi:MAG: glucoamylase family protein [Rhodanobacter sp.]
MSSAATPACAAPATISLSAEDSALLERVQRDSFHFFSVYVNPDNGLVADSSQAESPCSIAAVGFALSSYPVAVEHGWMSRAQALDRTLAALRFFDAAQKDGELNATGYKGFFFHFLHMASGQRMWQSELSVIDTALLLSGMLLAARYFSGSDGLEQEVRTRAVAIYSRVDWPWMQNGGAAFALAWTPEKGFGRHRWVGYSEGLIVYVLALGSPTHPVTPAAYAQWLSGYRWKRVYGLSYVYAGPLFIHQFSHLWIDFRGIRDAYMRDRDLDYFENSRRATCVHQEYARRNPKKFRNYHGLCWGLTASDGPGPLRERVHGRERKFLGYRARGAPYGPDDGTVAPWASIASLPFAPDIVMPTLKYLAALTYDEDNAFGFTASFNPTMAPRHDDIGWLSPSHFGLNQGPIVVMIENYRNDFAWALMRGCPYIRRGLERAHFSGGWLVAERITR